MDRKQTVSELKAWIDWIYQDKSTWGRDEYERQLQAFSVLTDSLVSVLAISRSGWPNVDVEPLGRTFRLFRQRFLIVGGAQLPHHPTDAEMAEAVETAVSACKIYLQFLDKSTKIQRTTKLNQALALLQTQPDWTTEQIANAVGCKANYLNQRKEFTGAKRLVKEIGRRDVPRGSRDREGRLEAWEGEEDAEGS
jgi:hypothetical protein